MKRSILITGVTGTGKSTVCDRLQAMGYEAHGIEDIEGMFAMYRKDTKELFKDYDNEDPRKVKNAAWLCDSTKLKELLSQQVKGVAFYCGIASNMDDVASLFNEVIVLRASPEVLHSRLSSREGSGDMGGTEESRQIVLGWKDWWENNMADRGAIILDADRAPEAIAEEILRITHETPREGIEFTKSS